MKYRSMTEGRWRQEWHVEYSWGGKYDPLFIDSVHKSESQAEMRAKVVLRLNGGKNVQVVKRNYRPWDHRPY